MAVLRAGKLSCGLLAGEPGDEDGGAAGVGGPAVVVVIGVVPAAGIVAVATDDGFKL